MNKEDILGRIGEKFPEAIKDQPVTDHIFTLEISHPLIRDVIQFLKEDPSLNFMFMTDLCAVHYPGKGDREFAMVYMLHNLEENFRIRLKTYMGRENLHVPTICDIYSAANWMERETYDFFGVIFDNHPNLKRIMNVDTMDYHPLRKEYPLEDGTRTDKDDRYFGRDGNTHLTFDNKKALAKNNG